VHKHWRGAAASIITVAIIPIVVEALIAYIKEERYSISRAVIVLSVLAAAAAVVLGINMLATRLQLALDLATLATGLIVTLVALAAIITKSRELSYVFDGSLAGLGLLISGLSGYLIYIQRTGVDLLMAVSGRARQPISVESRGTIKVAAGKFPAFAPEDTEILDLCSAVVRPDDVHFIAYYVNGECRFYVDSFDNPELNKFFRRIDRAERRAQYERAGRQVEWIISHLNVYLKHLERGILIRTVFDVEQGSLSYYYIDRGVYLAAVTMDQSKVLETDDRLRELVNRIGLLPRGWIARPESVQQIQA
jgi:hypothetical protein